MSHPATPPPRSGSPSPVQSPNEVTSLLPPTTNHVNHAHPGHGHPNSHQGQHHRKASVGGRSISGRSVAGSVRGYGTVPVTPGPAAQAPRVSKQGQRRILTTFPIQAAFFALVFLTFLSLVLTLILFLNTAMDFSVKFLPYRGSGFTEFWISLVGSWIGIGGVLFFSHPSYLFFLTALLTLLVHIPIVLLVLLSPPLTSAHAPLILLPLAITALTIVQTLLSNYLVRRVKVRESQRIYRMLTDAASRERAGEENVARGLVGVQGKGVWGRLVGFFTGLLGLIAGLAGLIIVLFLTIDLSISAYDVELPLPSSYSQLVRVLPPSSPWRVNIHLACSPSNSSFPTVLYNSASGVPGSLALLSAPLAPAAEDAENPGRWLFDLQQKGHVGKVCTWDRPGYGFSDVLTGADLGLVADALWLALEQAGELKGDTKLSLVGEGYGGLISRVLASRHAHSIHSILHLDAQTASTYFSSPGFPTFLRIVTSRLLPSLMTPLSGIRLPSVLLRRSTSLSRILASSYPLPSSVRLSESLQKARLQETTGALSHTSASFRALLESGIKYPRDTKAIVLSSKKRMDEDESWAEGQRVLAEEVTGDEGLLEWRQVENVDHFVCEGEGRKVCESAIKRLLKV